MRERPILFNDAMVRAILSGAKTQTRRPVKYNPACGEPAAWCSAARAQEPGWVRIVGDYRRFCHVAQPGDLLWVRECWAQHESITIYRANEAELLPSWEKWRPSIHMPRWASRLTLRVADVRVERVQDITEADARAEGFDGDCPVGYLPAYTAGPCRYHFAAEWPYEDAQSWTANPWVWVVSFERAEVPR